MELGRSPLVENETPTLVKIVEGLSKPKLVLVWGGSEGARRRLSLSKPRRVLMRGGSEGARRRLSLSKPRRALENGRKNSHLN